MSPALYHVSSGAPDAWTAAPAVRPRANSRSSTSAGADHPLDAADAVDVLSPSTGVTPAKNARTPADEISVGSAPRSQPDTTVETGPSAPAALIARART